MARLSFTQIETIWRKEGGLSTKAPLAAALAEFESSGHPTSLNNNASTGDYSVGLWQVNYRGTTTPAKAPTQWELWGRVKTYGPPATLLSTADKQAQAAISLSSNGSNFQGPWLADFQKYGTPPGTTQASVESWLTAHGITLGGTVPTTVRTAHTGLPIPNPLLNGGGGSSGSSNAVLTSATTGGITTPKGGGGFASILQFVTKFLNPQGPSGVTSFLNIPGNVQQTAQLILGRAIASLSFIIVGGVGLYLIINGPRGDAVAGGVKLLKLGQNKRQLDLQETRLGLAKQRLTQQAELTAKRLASQEKVAATVRRTQRTTNINRTTKVTRQSTIRHVRVPPKATPKSPPKARKATSILADA